MSRRRRERLDVYLNGRLVGQLARERSGALEFRYDAAWLDWNSAIPASLSLPLREDRYIGDAVLAVLDNLLPDSVDIRRRVAEQAGADGFDPFNLLRAIGRDCVGALQFVPADSEPPTSTEIDGRSVSDTEIAELMQNLFRHPLGLTDDDEFRISIAGAQEKTALLQLNGGWHIPHGASPTTHIFKPQLGVLPNGLDLRHSVENEHFCLALARAFDLPSASSSVYDFDGQRVLIVERFDRIWTRDERLLRIPQEDCCQALSVPPSRKYQSDGGPGIREIEELLKAGDDPEQDRRTFFKAQIFFWLIAATDGHAKNFSLRLGPQGRFRLAPLYDIMSTQLASRRTPARAQPAQARHVDR